MSDGNNDVAGDPWTIPNTWAWTKMGEVTHVVGGSTPRTSDSANYDGGDVPWITPADLSGYKSKLITRGARNITLKGLTESGARLMPAGTVLFSSRAPIGYVAIAAEPVSTNQGFKSFVLPDGLLPDYVYYYLQRAKELAIALASGTTLLEVSGAKAAFIPIPLAPLSEQHRIVAAIEQQFTRLDAAVAALEQARARLKRYRAAVLAAACAGRLVPTEAELARAEGHEYECVDALRTKDLMKRGSKGEVSKVGGQSSDHNSALAGGWRPVTLPQLITEPLANGRSVPNATDGFPVLRLTALKSGRIDLSQRKIGAWTEQEASQYKVRKGDFLVVRGNGSMALVGRGGLVDAEPDGVAYPDTLIRVRVDANVILPKYLRTVWNSDVLRRQVESTARTTAGIYKINQQDMQRYVIPLPPLPEQHRIVAEVERRLSVVDEMEATVAANLKHAVRLRQAILRRAFAGQLVPQDPNDESAGAQLERIRANRTRNSAVSRAGTPSRKPRATTRPMPLDV